MAWWVGALLGLIQGTFMFVPVSSTSHLALVQHLLDGWGVDIPPPESAEVILFDLVLHVGTLVSIVIIMRARLAATARMVAEDLRQLRPAEGLSALRSKERRGIRAGALLAVTTLTTGVLGLVVRAFAPEVFARPQVIAVLLAGTGAVLWWTDRAGVGSRTTSAVGFGVAVGIGVAQAVALLPGLSRSGLTIAAALALGLRRRDAAEYSFIVAIPTILAATVVQAADALRSLDDLSIPLTTWLVGFVVAAAVGTIALALVLRLLYAARFRVFSLYVWGLAAVVLVTGVGA